jgi:hypothetical protein
MLLRGVLLLVQGKAPPCGDLGRGGGWGAPTPAAGMWGSRSWAIRGRLPIDRSLQPLTSLSWPRLGCGWAWGRAVEASGLHWGGSASSLPIPQPSPHFHQVALQVGANAAGRAGARTETLFVPAALQLAGALDLPSGSCAFEEGTCGFDSVLEFLPWILNEEGKRGPRRGARGELSSWLAFFFSFPHG